MFPTMLFMLIATLILLISTAGYINYDAV